MESLFAPLKEEGLSGFCFQSYPGEDVPSLTCFREWSNGIDWSSYRRAFTWETKLDPEPVALGCSATRELYERYGLADHVSRVARLIGEAGHERVEGWLLPDRDIRFVNNVHSSGMGLISGRHAVRTGGIRRHSPEDLEIDVICDGLNLSRAMTYKNAAADIDFGGCKSIVIAPPIEMSDYEALGFIAYCIDRSRTFTGPDMGFSPHLSDTMNEFFSPNFGGGTRSGVGPSGPPTAHGVFSGILAACDAVYGQASVRDKRVAILGLGSVGLTLALLALNDGASLTVADLDEQAINRLLGAASSYKDRVQIVSSSQLLELEGDILSPCATGDLFDEEIIPNLAYKIVMPGANNTLRATSYEEEIHLARLMNNTGHYYQIEWAHNLGGVIAGVAHLTHGNRLALSDVIQIVEKRCYDFTRQNFEAAESMKTTPTEAAYKYADTKIASHKYANPCV